MGRFFLGLLVWGSVLQASPADGLCVYEKGPGGLLKANCQFPSCPGGVDCLPPSLPTGSAKIEYFEPLIQWKESCPSAVVGGACWEVYMDFKLQMMASDPNGVNSIGVNIAQDLDGKRLFKKYWSPAVKKEVGYEITGGMVVHVPPGRPLQLSVYELCAKDGLGNEGCVSPSAVSEAKRSWTVGHTSAPDYK